MDWFVYDNGIRHERVKRLPEMTLSPKKYQKLLMAIYYEELFYNVHFI